MKLFYSLKVSLAALVLILATTSSSSAFIIGDVNYDDIVRMDDALLVLRYLVGTSYCYPDQLTACDMSWALWQSNPGCDAPDVSLILGRANGLI